ncbi:hypothetical protein [Aneurinibacillus migulanus]|uniref:Uncharacterized protein n=1 Tax=Aneurinibacillus migulanus TaxID=47500 RepID=A0A1G8VQV2_ANEMI|nr:hypothetical protein [Aneurinibacillus migulanus]MCP1358931.1 hypothetical protein [Aneurinibacillus migulanus]MED0894294.1 hypothetical protein [Aneurinibacillus migulanus]MED1619567.1 hypothetical protein [Aneurinibacillus migulanus]SDJ68451.1 hypothetical protein SAMN04487909_12517 [Aneurinibacillus migulanus]GED17331.1 hypothetical protein AMI01nite_53220 [Aneurinibacillus migulanus]
MKKMIREKIELMKSVLEEDPFYLGLWTGILFLFRGKMRVYFARIPLVGITRANFLLF